METTEGIADFQLFDYVLLGIHANQPSEGPEAQTLRILNLDTLEWIDTDQFAQAKEGVVYAQNDGMLFISYGNRIIMVDTLENTAQFVDATVTEGVKATLPTNDGFVIQTKDNAFFELRTSRTKGPSRIDSDYFVEHKISKYKKNR